jgi:hypothetical protein
MLLLYQHFAEMHGFSLARNGKYVALLPPEGIPRKLGKDIKELVSPSRAFVLSSHPSYPNRQRPDPQRVNHTWPATKVDTPIST